MGPNTRLPPTPCGAVRPHGHGGRGATEPWISIPHDAEPLGVVPGWMRGETQREQGADVRLNSWGMEHSPLRGPRPGGGAGRAIRRDKPGMVLTTSWCRRPGDEAKTQTDARAEDRTGERETEKAGEPVWRAWEPEKAGRSEGPAVLSSPVQSLSRVRLCDPMDCSTPGLPVHHQLPEFTQTHAH